MKHSHARKNIKCEWTEGNNIHLILLTTLNKQVSITTLKGQTYFKNDVCLSINRYEIEMKSN